MPVYVALLRGINVGGKHSLPMAKVRATFEEHGATQVETYIQSGNVVFAHAQRSASTLCKQLVAALTDAAGFTVPAVLRSRTELDGIVRANPYPKSDAVHCAFLPAAPTEVQTAKLDRIDREAFVPSQFEVLGHAVYLDLPEGIGRDKLAASVLRAFPDATVRNWRTVTKLAEMLAAL